MTIEAEMLMHNLSLNSPEAITAMKQSLKGLTIISSRPDASRRGFYQLIVETAEKGNLIIEFPIAAEPLLHFIDGIFSALIISQGE